MNTPIVRHPTKGEITLSRNAYLALRALEIGYRRINALDADELELAGLVRLTEDGPLPNDIALHFLSQQPQDH